jgi:hypothetical protein
VPQDLLGRVHRAALGLCAAMAAVAFAIYPGGWRAAAAVLGGGLLSEISFLSIRGALDDAAARRRAGLIAGASSVVAAAIAEAVRFLWKGNGRASAADR